MHSPSPTVLTRRRFLARGAAGLAGLGAFGPLSVLHARRSTSPAADDYRALVCVFLYGGADTLNLLVPRSAAEYAVYAASRQGLAVPRESLLPIEPLTADGAEYGLHGSVAELAQRFASGQLAFVRNVGPLVAPATKAELESGAVPPPRHLFSHTDQQAQWQTAHADGPGTTGWCGRVADRLAAAEGATALATNISFDGPVTMLTGETVAPYAMDAGGSEPLRLFDPEEAPLRRAALLELLGAGERLLERELARLHEEAMEIDVAVAGALAEAPAFNGLFADASPLGAQLRTVARLVAARDQLPARRPIFFVAAGGYDTHDRQNELLPGLLRDLSRSLGDFQTALEAAGAGPLVTTFSASDFGRTLSSNGKGSDHGWGGHALVLGGAVRGGELYGSAPDLALGGPDDLGGGRLVPRIAVEQHAATLARWLGLGPADLAAVFPNLERFAPSDLGFLG